ncbi:MAG: TetR/AcrR family transcriptional regulator [Clostridiales bacterium]|nr:TetR/AcrR family transcriptional regulator [Clostridiales bacterium]
MPNFTRNAIIASFLKLLEERPLNKITIKDIVEDCGINRNSFYYHFQDIPALIGEIVSGEIDRIIKQYPSVDNFTECVKIAAEFSLNHRKAVLHVFNSVNRDIFENYMWRICGYLVEVYLRPLCAEHKVSESDKNVIIQFYKCEVFGQIIGWLDGGMKDDIIATTTRLSELRKGMIDELFKRCEKKG